MNISLKPAGSILPVLFLCLVANKITAQLTVSAQIRTRSEFRDGQGAPLPKGAKPAIFVSQRSRLMVAYNTYRLKLGLSIQDARVWGQDASTVNRTTTDANDGIMLHEAWAEILLSDTADKKHELSFKAGRQEIILDDQRLIGNLDWLQQARRHDAGLIKYRTGSFNLQGGFAFNQNKENNTGTLYNNTPAGSYAGNTNGGIAYKSFEFVHINKSYNKGNISLLLFADQFTRYHSETQVKIWDSGVWSRYTTGLYINHHIKQLDLTAAAYYQGGKSYDGRSLSAGLFSIATQYTFSNKFSAGPGYDYTSGGGTSSKSYAFDPLYGTPHKFWGLMDYFYAASAFGNKGLSDLYLKARYKLSPRLLLSGDIHEFSSASTVINTTSEKMSRRFGSEIDIAANYSFTKSITFEAGYSHFFSTGTLSSPGVKNVANGRNNGNWAYLSINIRPDLLIKP